MLDEFLNKAIQRLKGEYPKIFTEEAIIKFIELVNERKKVINHTKVKEKPIEVKVTSIAEGTSMLVSIKGPKKFIDTLTRN